MHSLSYKFRLCGITKLTQLIQSEGIDQRRFDGTKCHQLIPSDIFQGTTSVIMTLKGLPSWYISKKHKKTLLYSILNLVWWKLQGTQTTPHISSVLLIMIFSLRTCNYSYNILQYWTAIDSSAVTTSPHVFYKIVNIVKLVKYSGWSEASFRCAFQYAARVCIFAISGMERILATHLKVTLLLIYR